ncbi:threonine aldolase family protein [Candidatus Cardinium hertigii]|uniref:L-allo-threonine aldolase n=1 Tax=Candidatus Cardinium hertigii TaxID=247481 RepID=A0A2Z3L7V0_9BACT|nr:threonine aldolase family protein [Candidatus Cardinium hertigii]AWN81531.1 L-allo-threonine aldolase [Candidatus Cardinium hertigii]
MQIDFFSDTNTNPSKAMRQVMAHASVGNEAAGEDPTVNALIKVTCQLLGKPAALFLPSGTMCNVIAYKAHIQRPGDYILLDHKAHALVVQSGLIAGQAEATPLPIVGIRGVFTEDQIKEHIIRPPLRNIPAVRLVSIEQTTNFGGGAIWPLTVLQAIAALCKAYAVSMHLDGARLFNAAVATQVAVSAYAACFDSVFVDFSKGLGAPMGAVLAGEEDFIEKAWYYKFQLGGAMHQAGIIAAACLYGLEHHRDDLIEDHVKMKYLLEGLFPIHGIIVNPSLYQTNIGYFSLTPDTIPIQTLLDRLRHAYGIRMAAVADSIRVITHRDITYKAIDITLAAVKKILRVM